jgi:hypothetical protein
VKLPCRGGGVNPRDLTAAPELTIRSAERAGCSEERTSCSSERRPSTDLPFSLSNFL